MEFETRGLLSKLKRGSMSKLQAGDRVKHDFSNDRGVIESTRKDPQGYNYLVSWDYPDNGRPKRDWYKAEVLERIR